MQVEPSSRRNVLGAEKFTSSFFMARGLPVTGCVPVSGEGNAIGRVRSSVRPSVSTLSFKSINRLIPLVTFSASSSIRIFTSVWCPFVCLQCFDAVGWAAGRAPGL